MWPFDYFPCDNCRMADDCDLDECPDVNLYWANYAMEDDDE